MPGLVNEMPADSDHEKFVAGVRSLDTLIAFGWVLFYLADRIKK